ncbi:4-coumarate--CoA ligase 1-like isoform X2 [Homalodisca vitripennis]|uniref:4-coumarate--CoA ligase 1-like isoform X2 n=1 Tax=Homalodisca vitripennis TaxID=197043 RepID=UPI001EEB3620|nr:4-coumarate--CoA ligase 1-like isoform X2 [Homalodisca vitripennis]XP_046679648.1 4-coumarate--CoA ligase 1-like isoform X2 [Homalodisca vitripennis]XP_046679649.1 4-coumarate--CoA ligase 1-like isoform X2 [Homalodisca vitripennis]XP_046679650.1 4-coumarate--CoA ligase 1-like isoform X2 [Homalodisca vitripennis]
MSYLKGPDVEKALPHFRRNISVLDLLEASLRKGGDATVVVEGQTGKTASFADILQQSTAAAAGLQSAGISAGDYIVLCCDKSILSYSLLLGIMFTGATAVLCPPGKADIIHEMTKGHRVKAAFFHKKYSELVKASLSSMDTPPSLVAVIDSEDPQMNAIITSEEECVTYKVLNPEEHVSIILFSSGTTGEPKGIQMSDTAITLMGVLFAPHVKTLFNASPFYWHTGVMTHVSPILNSINVRNLVWLQIRTACKNSV